MKKITIILVLTMLLVSVSGCVFETDDTSCNVNVSKDVDYEGILYKTQCAEMGPSKVGLINTNFDLVISETYMNIDRGFTMQYQGYDNIEFDKEIEYFRTLYQEDYDLKQAVIDRKGERIIEAEIYADVLISRNQEYIYLYNDSAQIYHIPTKTYEPVDYRIVQTMGDYHIANMNGSQIVLDGQLNIIHEDYYERVIFVSNENIVYEKDDFVISENLLTNSVVRLFNTLEYPSNFMGNDWPEYFLINSNSYRNVFFIDSQTGEHIDIEECSKIVNYHQDTFSMRCDVGYKVFAKDTLEPQLEVPRSQTELIYNYPIYFDFGEIKTTLHSIEKTIALDSIYVSHQVLPGELLQVRTEEYNLYIDLQTFEELYQTDTQCRIVQNSYNNNLLIYEGNCSIGDSAPNVEMLSLDGSILKNEDLEIVYYTDEFIFFLKDGKTIITDYEFNVLYE